MKSLLKPLLSLALIVTCMVAVWKPTAASPLIHVDRKLLVGSMVAFIVAFATSWFVCWLIIRYEDMHAHFSHDGVDSGPQKFHGEPTARIGGVALATGLLAGVAILFAMLPQISVRDHANLVLACVPAFLGGLVEDITKRVGVTERLLLTMLSAAIGVLLLGALLNRVDVPLVDAALRWTPFAFAVTVIAVGGVANAVNIIDGYNGLAGGVALIALVTMAWIAGQVGDFMVLSCALAIAGTILGFLLWNWPEGKIFMGDGGAYLVGFLLAELSVLLVIRNPTVSAWLPLALLIHPILETLFSIYRRRFVRGQAPGRPDALHIHQLIFSRLLRMSVGSKCTGDRLRRNSCVAPYIWAPCLIVCLLSGVMYSNAIAMFSISALYAAIYIFGYRTIIHRKVPKFLIRRGL